MPYASVYPLVTARAVARAFTYEVPDDVGVGAIVRVPFGRSRARGIVDRARRRGAQGVDARPIESVVGELPPTLVELALWLADYYGSTPARALALVAPETPKRRKEQAPPAERQALAGEAQPAELSARAARGGSRGIVDGGPGNVLLYGATGSGKTEVYLQACAAMLERGLRRDHPRARDRARAADRRARPGAFRRARRDPPLGPDRRRATRRARADRERRGAHRRRRALGDLRADPRARPDRRRRGARRLVQAGLRPALRRAHRRGEARGARGRGRGVRLGDTAPGELGGLERLELGGRLGASLPPVRVVDLRREAGYPLSAPLLDALRASPSAAARRSCCSTAAASRRRSTAARAGRRSAARTATSRSCCTATRRFSCHHCGFTRDAPATCPTCGSPDLARLGAGTQKLERELARELPELELIRLDADAVAKPEQLAALLAPLRRDGGRGAARHADGGEGPPLRGRRARRRRRRRHGARHARLPRGGAHVPADHAARRAQRPRRARPRARADVPARRAARSPTRRATTSRASSTEELERRRRSATRRSRTSCASSSPGPSPSRSCARSRS